MSRPRLLILAAAAAALLLPAPAVFASTGPPVGFAGVHAYNTPVCGSEYVPVNLGAGDYFNVYNAQNGTSCVNVSGWHDLAWSVTKAPTGMWESPAVSSGWDWGRYTCDDGRSALPSSPGSECMRYPVQQQHDGIPVTSVTFWRPPADGDAGYDIWFNKTDAHPDQNDGAEIMIRPWNSNVGIGRGGYWAVICKQLWYVEHWTGDQHGVTWNYVTYIAPRNTNHLDGIWLNQFFRDAEAHGLLSKYWWLTAVDFLAEMNDGTGLGFTVARYSLSGVR